MMATFNGWTLVQQDLPDDQQRVLFVAHNQAHSGTFHERAPEDGRGRRGLGIFDGAAWYFQADTTETRFREGVSRWRPEALSAEEETVLRAVAWGKVEHFEDTAEWFRRVAPGVTEPVDTDLLFELQRMGYVEWAPFTQSTHVVRAELTDRGREWLSRWQMSELPKRTDLPATPRNSVAALLGAAWLNGLAPR